MLGSPPSNFYGIPSDRLRHPYSNTNIPHPYTLQQLHQGASKLIRPTSSTSPGRPEALLPTLSPRGASKMAATNTAHVTSTGSEVFPPIGTSRRRLNGLDLRSFPSKVNPGESATPSWSSLTSSRPDLESVSSSVSSNTSSSSSSSSSSKPSSTSLSSPGSSSLPPPTLPSLSFPPGFLLPGLTLNPMTSALALKMFTYPQNILHNNNNNNDDNNNKTITTNNNNNLSNQSSRLSLPRYPPKTLTHFPKPHPYFTPIGPQPQQHKPPPSSPLHKPPQSRLPSPPPLAPSTKMSSPPSSSSSSSVHPAISNNSDIPPSVFPFPKLFTSYLTPEEQHQQYLTMLSLHQQTAAVNTPSPSSTSPSTSKELPPFHGLKTGPASASSASAYATRNYLELAMLVCNTFRGKLFPCPHCRYVTDRRNNLKRHVATMHQACDKQLECCGVAFATKASLREHIAIFHHNGYSCTFCGRRFCRKALLKRHLSVHNGQKDYTCPSCDYATSHKSNLERHKRIHARLPENGESPIYPDTSLDDDVTNDDIDFKDRNDMMNIKMTSSPAGDYAAAASMAGLPFYYNRLYKSFTGHEVAASHFLSTKQNGGISHHGLPGMQHNPFLHNPYNNPFFKDGVTGRTSDHVTDLSVTSTTLDMEGQGHEIRIDDDNSDTDIDIDSVDDDNDTDILENSSEVTEEMPATNETTTKSAKSSNPVDNEHADDGDDNYNDNDDVGKDNKEDDHPLNLVKVRDHNEK